MFAPDFHTSGEVHLHFLILNNPKVQIEPQLLSRVMTKLWVEELQPLDLTHKGLGTAHIEPYDSYTHGPAGDLCLCKRQFGEEGKGFVFSESFWKHSATYSK